MSLKEGFMKITTYEEWIKEGMNLKGLTQEIWK